MVRAFSAAPKRVAQFKPMVPNLIGRNAQLAGVLYSQAEAKGTQANVGASLDSLNAIVSEGVWATKVEELNDHTVESKASLMIGLCDKLGVDQTVSLLAAELVRQDEVRAVTSISENYEVLYRYKQNIFDVTITSALPLTNAQRDLAKSRVAAMLPEGSQIQCIVNTDAKLMGGLTIQIEDQIIDLSTSTQIADLVEHVDKQGCPDLALSSADFQKLKTESA